MSSGTILPLILVALVSFGQDKNVLNGIATDGHRNPVPGVNVLLKGTLIGTVTDACGRFSIRFDDEQLTVLFHGMSYADMRTYEVSLKRSEIVGDTLVFQLGHLKAMNADCKKVKRKIKRRVIE